MSEIIYHKPPRRLAALLSQPGGLTAAESVARAEQGLAFMQDACLESIDAGIARVSAAVARLQADEADPRALTQLYAAADEIVGLAGPAQLEPLGQAAYSLCELTDRFQESGKVVRAAVQVHLEALKLLRRPPAEHGGDAGAQALLAGLHKVVRSV